VSKEDEDPRVLKLFVKPDEYITELGNLNKIRDILQDRPEYAHVPKIDRPLMKVIETISGREYQALMSLPLCVPIGPQRGGSLLQRPHYLQLLNTLEVVHAERLFNCDIKPSNVLMYGDDSVLCDWGSAVFAKDEDPLPVRSFGTIGYCDFTLLEPAPPYPSHDLMALVRTVYANYTHQLVSSDQSKADEFWEENFRKGSLWKKAMKYASEANYAKLKKVFLLL
jgi:serine/threonine protein kinase